MPIALEDRKIQNAIEEAVYGVLGGIRPAAERLQVSTQALYQLLTAGVVKNREAALRIAAATRAVGCEVPAAELMDLIPWTGPRPGWPVPAPDDDPPPLRGKGRAARQPKPARPARVRAGRTKRTAAHALASAVVVRVPVIGGVRGGSITRPVVVPSPTTLLLRAHAALAATETRDASSEEVTRCSVKSIPPISQGVASAAAVGNRKASRAAVSPCSLRPKILIFRARRVQKRAFRRAA
jgi:DNA-binding transcriptional regulator YdaS (Cro superfamily)